MKESRYALLKNEENLTEKQRIKFEAIRAANFEVSRALEAGETFKEVSQNAGYEESESIFWEWFETVKKTAVKKVIKVAGTFSEHLLGESSQGDDRNARITRWQES